ncbi:MAG: helix-turn-helix domain-containing protein [Pseudonocardiaceae bacterium]
MARSIPACVEPSVLRWARETVGLTPVAAARKIGVPDGRVDEWEAGTTQPTIAQLRKAADAYRRPLGVFFLPEPPLDFDTMRDFRRHVGAEADEWSPELHGEYRRAIAQREAALELAEIDDASPPTTWQLEPLPDDDELIAAAARSLLLSHSPLPPAQERRDHVRAPEHMGGCAGGGRRTRHGHRGRRGLAQRDAGVLAVL